LCALPDDLLMTVVALLGPTELLTLQACDTRLNKLAVRLHGVPCGAHVWCPPTCPRIHLGNPSGACACTGGCVGVQPTHTGSVCSRWGMPMGHSLGLLSTSQCPMHPTPACRCHPARAVQRRPVGGPVHQVLWRALDHPAGGARPGRLLAGGRHGASKHAPALATHALRCRRSNCRMQHMHNTLTRASFVPLLPPPPHTHARTHDSPCTAPRPSQTGSRAPGASPPPLSCRPRCA
jgi:hypothetical protein